MDGNRGCGGPVLWTAVGVAAIPVLLFLFVNFGGVTVVFEVPYYLAAGWAYYLGRVVPRLRPDPAAVGSAVLCLVGVVCGGHAFLRWVYAATGPENEPRRWPWRWTLKLVGLVVLMFVAGVAVVGLGHQTGWLLRSPEPLVRDRYGYDGRMHSANNLKNLGLAAHNWASASNDDMPRARFDAFGRPLHSWQTAILPQLERSDVYNRIDLTKPWTDPANAPAMRTPVRPLLNRSIGGDGTVNGYAATHYAGNVDVFLTDRPRNLARFPGGPVGLSNTIMAGEVASNVRAWGDPMNVRDPRLGMGHPDGFGGPGRRPLFVMMDASVRSFDPAELAGVAGRGEE